MSVLASWFSLMAILPLVSSVGQEAGTDAAAPLVVIDPGHGGTNTGAPGFRAGLYEKQLTMAVALCVRDDLRERGYRVALTREDDRYLSLRQRGSRANALNADVFVSIHANATESHDQRGFETFVLTPDALDIDGRALRTDDGRTRAGVDRETSYLLDDVERGIALPMSAELALAVQTRMRAVRGAEFDRGVRQASMHVLLGATMPAVLVEIGFIDHPVEGAELLDPAMQKQICGAIAGGIAGS